MVCFKPYKIITLLFHVQLLIKQAETKYSMVLHCRDHCALVDQTNSNAMQTNETNWLFQNLAKFKCVSLCHSIHSKVELLMPSTMFNWMIKMETMEDPTCSRTQLVPNTCECHTKNGAQVTKLHFALSYYHLANQKSIFAKQEWRVPLHLLDPANQLLLFLQQLFP